MGKDFIPVKRNNYNLTKAFNYDIEAQEPVIELVKELELKPVMEQKPLPKLEVTFKKNQLEQEFKVVGEVLDQAELIFTKEGFTVRGADQQMVNMIDLSVPKTIFKSYSLEGESEKIGIDLKILNKALKSFDKDSELTIRLDKENGKVLIQNGFLGATSTIPVLDLQSQDLPEPRLTPTTRFTCEQKLFQQALKGCQQAGYIVKIEANDNVTLSSKGNSQDYKTSLQTVDLTIKSPTKAYYHADHPLKFLKHLKNMLVTFEFSNNMPCKMSCGNLNTEPTLKYYIAPTNEEE